MNKRKTGMAGIIITIILLIILVFISNLKLNKFSYIENAFSKLVMPFQSGITYLKQKLTGNDNYFATMDYLKQEGIEVVKMAFPSYDSPTGKIIGGPYLGKSYICDGWFPEGSPNVNEKVASLYYAADRLYNIDHITKYLEKGYTVILDRYTYSNMAHRGGKLEDKEERLKCYNFIENF